MKNNEGFEVTIEMDYRLLGTGQVFPKGKYWAVKAINIPDYDAMGKIFIRNEFGCDLLLSRDEYHITSS